MTPDQLAALQRVNDQWNVIPFQGVPATGESIGSVKDAPDGGSWVCRDYTQAKATALREAGWPAETLTTLECWTEPLPGMPNGGYHEVLAVQDGGEFWILDNREPSPYIWAARPLPYHDARKQVAGTEEFEPFG